MTALFNKIVFLGGVFPQGRSGFYFSKSKNTFQAAADSLQWAIINGLESVSGRPVTIVSLPFVGDFPRDYADAFVHGDVFSRNGTENYIVGFFNLKLFNLVAKYISCRLFLLRMLNRFAGCKDLRVLVYGAFPYLIYPAIWLRKVVPGARVFLIVPDLPDMMGGDNSRLHIRLFNRLNSFLVRRAVRNVDGFVFLTEAMVDRFTLGDKPWCVVEGIASARAVSVKMADSKDVNILYSGTLARRYGILDLLDAFRAIDGENFRLWVCGGGEAASEIEAAARQDSRIRFYGLVSREEALRLQEAATLLVNPRTADGDYTKYSFPSKILEYYSSGTPCIMHRLPGVPAEYFEHCLVPATEDAAGLQSAILQAVVRGEEGLRELGLRAKAFVETEKTAERQCRKILDLMNQ